MAWDKNQPVGSVIANQLDDLIRANNDGLEAALNKEHHFTTGGNLTGVHKFGVGTEANRTATTGIAVQGAVWILTGGDIPAGQGEFTFYDTTVAAWRKAGGRMLLELNSNWTKAQYGDWVTIPVTAGPTYIPDFSASNFFKIQPITNFSLVNPINKPAAGKAASYVFEITQDGDVTPEVITFDSAYVFTNGQAPVLSTGAGAVDLLYGVLRSDGKVHISIDRDSKV